MDALNGRISVVPSSGPRAESPSRGRSDCRARSARRACMRWGICAQNRCQANMAQVRQSRPDSGLGMQVNGLRQIDAVPFSLQIAFQRSDCTASSTRMYEMGYLRADRCQANMAQVRQTFIQKDGSRQGQNLALAALYVPSSLDSGIIRVKWQPQS